MRIPFNLKSIWFGGGILSIIVYLSSIAAVVVGFIYEFELYLLVLYVLLALNIIYKIILTVQCIRNIPAIIFDGNSLHINYGFRFGLNDFKTDEISYIDIKKKDLKLLTGRFAVNLMVVDRAGLQLLNDEILRAKATRTNA